MDLQLITVIFFAMVGSSAATCGYENCPKTNPDMINVHLVPHTHDDVGWLKTVDEYFYGSKKDITPVGVQYILDSVVPELLKDPAKRFIYVEMAFFYRWWRQQNDQMRHQVRTLVQNGQLEFILGGWCMNDEAAAHYNAIIDQMTWGLKFINDTFGECARPKVAWQIDPFGHSREQASLFAQMGFEGLFFGRLDYADKEKRMASKTMELMWKGSDVLGNSSWLLTGALFNGYGPPNGYCFDAYCDDEPIMDDPRLYGYNVNSRVQGFIDAVKEQARSYSTNNIIMTMGEDFNYVNANSWYKNLDKLIKHTNARQAKGSNINLIYSTPSCYLKSLHDSKKSYTVKRDDFFPYASDPHAYWTGYFSSRPALKGMIRHGNNFLQVCKQLGALTTTDWVPGPDGDVTVMREAMGVLQHHDAVTGTAKQAVTFDYAEKLANGFSECEKVIDYAYRYLAAKDTKDLEHKQRFCRMLNITQCPLSETESNFVVNIYNPLVRKVSKFIRLPVQKPGYIVYDSQGNALDTQIVPIPEVIQLIPGRKSSASFELIFKAGDIPGLGFKSFYVSKQKSSPANEHMSKLSPITHKRSVGNANLQIGINKFGRIDKILKNGQIFEFGQAYGYYEGHAGNNTSFNSRASGAYIFRPIHQDPVIVNSNEKPLLVKGPLVKEVHQKFSPFIHQVARIYQDSQDLELEWLVGPIPVSDGIGKEIIVRYKSGFASNGMFFTDSNGRQMMERVRNKRPTWDLNVTEPVSCNYYPVNSRMFIKDPSTGSRMTVLTDRSQGGTSMQDGVAELMIHRRLLYDDAFGVGEALDEVAYGQGLVVRGKHWVQFSNGGTDTPDRKHRFKAQEAFMDTVISFTPTNLTFDQFRAKYSMMQSALGSIKLPKNIHLLTLEEWHGNSRDSILIRFEHMFDANEDLEYSEPVSFKMNTLFANFKFTYVEEVILGANLRADKLHRMEWNVEQNNNKVPIHQEDDVMKPVSQENGYEITLRPMQIRSFICNIEPK